MRPAATHTHQTIHSHKYEICMQVARMVVPITHTKKSRVINPAKAYYTEFTPDGANAAEIAGNEKQLFSDVLSESAKPMSEKAHFQTKGSNTTAFCYEPKKTFTPIPEDIHVAVLVEVIELGMQPGYQGERYDPWRHLSEDTADSWRQSCDKGGRAQAKL